MYLLIGLWIVPCQVAISNTNVESGRPKETKILQEETIGSPKERKLHGDRNIIVPVFQIRQPSCGSLETGIRKRYRENLMGGRMLGRGIR